MHKNKSFVSSALAYAAFVFAAWALHHDTAAHPVSQSKGTFEDKFRQLDETWPTANTYRVASGAPGADYWQQRADYVIKATLDEKAMRLTASETITYTNNAPESLRYLWVQLDQNRFKHDSLGELSLAAGESDIVSYNALRRRQAMTARDHGYEIKSVRAAGGAPLPYTIVDTMMRIDLPRPLRTGRSTTFSIDWAQNIIDEEAIGGRGGVEVFEDGHHIFALAQWFPRMAAYSDYEGWHTKPYLGLGEFALEFGDYDVSITVPADHVVSATGVLQNPGEVLSATQRRRLEAAGNADEPVFIVTPDEALENEKEGTDETRTWRFKAENVRDYAWASSRKFVWDAMTVEQDDEDNPSVLIMSFYPNEGEPLWSKYSSHVVAHTIEVFNHFAFPYPYPNAQSVNVWDMGGMEYPMVTFNGFRPTDEEKVEDRTYSRETKYGLITVIIHEIGHIYYPMVVNSDERQWAWMDEGINTFLHYTAHFLWEEGYPNPSSGRPSMLDRIPDYMVSANQVPIMTQSDSILQYANNAYMKPTAALTILRETILGRELFDFAFREYARRWKFKRPTPSDFFRTMEDASGVDLDWFWRGWFYSTDHVDISIEDVRAYRLSTGDPDQEFAKDRIEARRDRPEPLTPQNNRAEGIETYTDRFPELRDFYNDNDRYTVSNADRNSYNARMAGLEDWEKDALESALQEGENIYFVDFRNIGGLVMPLPITIVYADGSEEEMMIPAEIWRRNAQTVTKRLMRDKTIVSIELDARHEIADADRNNNYFPRRIIPSRLEAFKVANTTRNLMADMLLELKSESEEKEEDLEANESAPLVPVDSNENR